MKNALRLAPLLLLCAAAPPEPKRIVYGWFPASMNDWSTSAIDWKTVTHLSFRSVVLKPDGAVEPGYGATPERIRKLVEEAHRHGVKVTVLTWGTTPEGSSKYLAAHQEKIVDGLLAFVKTHNLDGVNIDDETWQKTNSTDNGPNRERVTAFFKLLRDKLKAARPDCHLSWASPGVISPDDKFGDSWPDYKAIADLIDAYTVMSYVMAPPGIGWTGSAQPLGGGGKVGSHPRDYRTLVQDYLAATGGRKEKLVLGLGNDRGGAEWDCRTDRPLAPVVGRHRPLTAAEARANAEKHGRKFDPNQKAPWYCYAKGDGFVQGWYEDDESMAAKLAFFREQDLAGVCIWVLDGAKEPPETFQVLRKHFLE
jgi:spore germination protein YaaH